MAGVSLSSRCRTARPGPAPFMGRRQSGRPTGRALRRADRVPCYWFGAMQNAGPNAETIRGWNEVQGPRWLAFQDRLDAQLDPIGLAALARLPLARGARV